MPDTSRTAYLFQCEGEELYAVSHDITGSNIPRSPCTLGWRLCEEFQLGRHLPVPAPILPEPILKGIAEAGYYVWRGWSGGPSKRPARQQDRLVPALRLAAVHLADVRLLEER